MERSEFSRYWIYSRGTRRPKALVLSLNLRREVLPRKALKCSPNSEPHMTLSIYLTSIIIIRLLLLLLDILPNSITINNSTIVYARNCSLPTKNQLCTRFNSLILIPDRVLGCRQKWLGGHTAIFLFRPGNCYSSLSYSYIFSLGNCFSTSGMEVISLLARPRCVRFDSCPSASGM